MAVRARSSRSQNLSSFNLLYQPTRELHVSTFVATLRRVEGLIIGKEEALMRLHVKKRGNSLSVIVPKEMAIGLNVRDGDNLFATKTPSGYEISAYDPGLAKKIEAARKGIKKYRNALVELAK